MFWVYSIGLWFLLLAIVFVVYVYYNDNPNFKKIMTSTIILAVFVGVKTQFILNRSNVVGNEYYSTNESRYKVRILSGNEVSVNFGDEYDDSNFVTMYYSKHGDELVIDQDDVYDNYKNFITGVKIKLTDDNKKARIIYSLGNKETDKGDTLTLKK
ncbi:hypothetical protein [Companilactobacillus keshanensis]|uniref:Uncharacterized protein n=1 Tax=Companilactobacillus keshanensis TaxID=2486003 RepID=A0ABW4BUT1_9LACO|nr:hypothetical protein [Companilactobacillus keshanensis]